MKFFKNIIIISTMCTIGSGIAKNLKTTEPSPRTATPSSPTKINRTPQQQPQFQHKTYRQVLTEMRNIKESDVLTKDKSKFTDKIIQIYYNITSSDLQIIEKDALSDAFMGFFILEKIVPINEVDKATPPTVEKLRVIMEDADARVKKLQNQNQPKEEQYQPREQNVFKQDQPQQPVNIQQDMHQFISNELEHKNNIFFGNNAQGETILREFNEMFNVVKIMYGFNDTTFNLFKEEIYTIVSKLNADVKQQLIPLLNNSYSPVFRDIGSRLEYEAEQLTKFLNS